MGQITSSIGLISGINTGAIINALLQLDQEPVTILQTQISSDNEQAQVYTQFTNELQTLQQTAKSLGQTTTFQAATTTSSNPNVLTATASTGAALGSFQFQVAQLVTSQQAITNGFADSNSTPVGAGTLTISLGGGQISTATPLSMLNGGAGVQSGTFKITDAAGGTATIDTANDITLDDIVNQINSNTSIDVKASVGASGLVLQDLSGGSGKMSVQDIGSGQAAASLGIAGTATGGILTGSDINFLSTNTALTQINDGLGIQTADNGTPDFQITDANGDSFNVNLASAKSIGDVINLINTATGSKVTAAISSSGQSLTLTDNSGGSGTLSVTDLNSRAADDLGLTGSSSTGTLTGKNVLASLDSVLVSSLNGGQGLDLGSINVTDRQGKSLSINLSGAQSVSDVLKDINQQGAGAVTAAINSAGDGIQIQDVSGGSGNLSISDGDATDTATALGIAGTFGTGTSVVQGKDLDIQYISQNSLLSDYDGGTGVAQGNFQITNAAGKSATVNITSSALTLGDVINDINAQNIDVTASINSTGDGLLLTDNSSGSGHMTVTDADSSTARDLNIAGTASANTINGSFTKTIDVTANDTLTTVAQKINKLGFGISANVINDGSTRTPYRLSLTANNSGADGQFTFDAGSTNLQTSNLVQAQDAAVFVGGQNNTQPLLITSSSNQLSNVINGVTINLVGASSSPVTLNVSQDTSGVVNQLQSFTTDFNNMVNQITSLTSYNSTNNIGGLLLGDATTQDVSESLYNGILNTVMPTGNYRTLASIGLTVGNNGLLQFDSSTFQNAIASDPTDVQNLFTQATNGAGVQISNQIQQLVNPANGVITLEQTAINNNTQQYQDRITELNQMIDNQRNMWEQQFADMETSLASLQSQGAVINNMATLDEGLTSTTKSSGSSSASA